MTRRLPICIHFQTKIFKVNSIYLHENPMKNQELHEHNFLLSNMSPFWNIYCTVVYIRNGEIA